MPTITIATSTVVVYPKASCKTVDPCDPPVSVALVEFAVEAETLPLIVILIYPDVGVELNTSIAYDSIRRLALTTTAIKFSNLTAFLVYRAIYKKCCRQNSGFTFVCIHSKHSSFMTDMSLLFSMLYSAMTCGRIGLHSFAVSSVPRSKDSLPPDADRAKVVLLCI